MDLGLDGSIAVVTGGSSGIGLACVRILLGEGARVALCARDAARLATVTDGLKAEFGRERVFSAPCDVTMAEPVHAFRDRVTEVFGGTDILINNAGQGRVSTFADTTDAAWREELDLKFFSQINMVRAFEPLLRRSAHPAIVAVNSLLAYQPEPHMVCTSAARAGVQSLLKSLARELAPAIRVNSILLGLIDSGQWRRRFEATGKPAGDYDAWLGQLADDKQIPLGRLGRPDEAARAAVFLASPAASFITGAQLEVSGGISRFI